MSDSDFTAHETDEFTEEDDCENGVDCITQPLEPNDFVLLKLLQKQRRAIFCSADPISGAGWLHHHISEEATHILGILFPKD